MTHTDPKAEAGAIAVALAAHLASRNTTVAPEVYLNHLESRIGGEAPELITLISSVVASVNAGQKTEAFVDAIGLTRGVSGYIYHSVPVAIHAWLSHQQDCREAITTVVRCGGDTDSTGAIVGGIVGAAVGRSGIPEDWLLTLAEWPRTVEWMETLAKQLSKIGTTNSHSRHAICFFSSSSCTMDSADWHRRTETVYPKTPANNRFNRSRGPRGF
jgi:ADP-ribosylglycohydrolase